MSVDQDRPEVTSTRPNDESGPLRYIALPRKLGRSRSSADMVFVASRHQVYECTAKSRSPDPRPQRALAAFFAISFRRFAVIPHAGTGARTQNSAIDAQSPAASSASARQSPSDQYAAAFARGARTSDKAAVSLRSLMTDTGCVNIQRKQKSGTVVQTETVLRSSGPP
jgi:hypothetical protein